MSELQAVQYHKTDWIVKEDWTIPKECDMPQCEYHPQMQERVGKTESEIGSLKNELDEIRETLKEINKKLDTRYPVTILWVMTVMSGTIGVLATIVLNRYV